MDTSIKPVNERRKPNSQTIVDIFKGSWKSCLPGNLETGQENMFADGRIEWFNSILPNGILNKTVLELGPFEGYQTYLLQKFHSKEIISVEANSFNFLKCLCVKEIYNLNVRYNLGDALSFMKNCKQYFDIVWSSGILYHMHQPIDFLDQITERGDCIYIWTHYFDDDILKLTNGQEKHFYPQQDRTTLFLGKEYRLYARNYNIINYNENIPQYWEGGLDEITFWLTKETILEVLQMKGFKDIIIHADSMLNGLPIISLAASKNGFS